MTIVLVLTKSNTNFNIETQQILNLIAFLQFFQNTMINIIKFIYGIYTLIYHKERLEVRTHH